MRVHTGIRMRMPEVSVAVKSAMVPRARTVQPLALDTFAFVPVRGFVLMRANVFATGRGMACCVIVQLVRQNAERDGANRDFCEVRGITGPGLRRQSRADGGDHNGCECNVTCKSGHSFYLSRAGHDPRVTLRINWVCRAETFRGAHINSAHSCATVSCGLC